METIKEYLLSKLSINDRKNLDNLKKDFAFNTYLSKYNNSGLTSKEYTIFMNKIREFNLNSDILDLI